MAQTENLGLHLLGTSSDDLKQKFLEWRQNINGVGVNSNMEIIDKAIADVEKKTEGTIKSINGLTPDSSGSVTITPDDVGALPAGDTQMPNDIQFADSNGLSWTTADGTIIKLRPYAPDNVFQLTMRNPTTGVSEFGAVNVQTDGSVSLSRSLGTEYWATFTAAGWSSSAPYSQTVSVPGILGSDKAIADLAIGGTVTASSDAILEAWGCIDQIIVNDGSVTAYCVLDKPTVQVSARFIVLR